MSAGKRPNIDWLKSAVSDINIVIDDLAGEFTVEHLWAAECWDDRYECLKWAVENRATVKEMQAWHRAQNGLDLFGDDYVPEKQKRKIPNVVMQTTPTNCFRACVATVLALRIDDVPMSCDGATWHWDDFQLWLSTRGLQAIEVGFGNGGTIYPVVRPVRCILSGKSPRECPTGRHAVVGWLMGLEGFKLDHDPHPSELWIDGEPTHAVFFVGIDQ